MEFRVLGPLEVLDTENPLPTGGPKQRTVLALLVLNANRVVTVDRLGDALWGSEPPETARNTLQTYVRHLRKALGAERIEHRSNGYVLHADADEIDLLRFESLLGEAHRLTPADPPRAIATYDRALDLWRGPALDDLAGQPALQPEIARLEESRLAAVEDRIAAELARGRHRELVPELEVLVRTHPFRERLWGHLMVALYRSGRQGDALAAYRRARAVLVEELGIDPSPELHLLEEQVLRQDPDLDLAGEPLRGYRLLERIGEGAFGVVHRAEQPQVGREVAVKVIRPELANDPDFVRGFEREARLIARLEHRHIVPLYDYWRDREGAYLVMRLLRGGSLRTRIERSGPLTIDEAKRILEQVAQALATALGQGIVHGDVKPENILLDDDGNAYLSDFGIARELAGSPVGGSDVPPPYASPERVRGAPPGPATDIYALGMVIRHALAGRQLSQAVRDVLATACAEDPSSRYADAPAFAAAFDRALGTPTEPPAELVAPEVANPYKGLRSFEEPDARDFFGRERMVDRLVARLAERTDGSRLLAVVGPSGSGKSSLVRAGLVPSLRRGALPGSESWFTTELTPGAHPFHELEDALTRVAIDPPSNLVDELRDQGLVAVADRILPPDGTELFLLIDQFEELFTLTASDRERSAFLATLADAVSKVASRVRIVLVLRADFYDRPLLDPHLGPTLASRTEAITPLAPEELAEAIARPAQGAGVSLEPALMAEMLAEVVEQPSALPLLQFALTELFERRVDGTMTIDAYRELGRVSGALVGRAEELFAAFDAAEQETCRQVFLRLVEPGEGAEDTRRRVARSELDALGLDPGATERVIDVFGGDRLLAFDRDAATREPTVELAHEALIRVWGRLRGWVDESREDLRIHSRLTASADEWMAADREPSFLLGGERLERVAAWAGQTHLALDPKEREFVSRSVERRQAEIDAERAREDRERALERRSVRRLRGLVAALAAAALIASGLTIVAANRSRESDRSRNDATVAALTEASLSHLASDPRRSLALALHAVNLVASIHEPVPASTVEALHWAMQEANIEYPVRDGPAAIVAGPEGSRGVFPLPVSGLANTVLSEGIPQLDGSDCQLFFGSATCPALPVAFPSDLAAEPVRSLAPSDPARPLAGTQVTFFGGYDQDWIDRFRKELAPFTKRTGIEVRLVGNPQFFQSVEEMVAAGDPPDLALLPQPGAVRDFARSGDLIDLGAFVDPNKLSEDQSPYLVSLGTIGSDGSWPSDTGDLFGAFLNVNLKGMIWYPKPEFRAAGYRIPHTWRELMSLTDRMVADGRTPWCMGWREPGAASGWPGTDWIENAMLMESGPKTYDRWTAHEIPFDSPPVREAFQRLGEVLFAGGGDTAERASTIDDSRVQRPMLQDPPGCWLYQFPSFLTAFLPEGSVGTSVDYFPFPAGGGGPRTVFGAGGMFGAFSDRPEVREVVRFMLSRRFGTTTFAARGRFISANHRFDIRRYPPFEREQAKLIYAALGADTFRFDASDLMPAEIGADLFWKAMMKYAARGPGSVDGILARLDAAWPSQG